MSARRRREIFFHERSFVWKVQLLSLCEKSVDAIIPLDTPGLRGHQINRLIREESVTMSILLGCEDVAPSLPSEASDLPTADKVPLDRFLSNWEESDIAQPWNEYRSSADPKDSSNGDGTEACDFLTLTEAAMATRHIQQHNIGQHAQILTSNNGNHTEYARQTAKIAAEIIASGDLEKQFFTEES